MASTIGIASVNIAWINHYLSLWCVCMLTLNFASFLFWKIHSGRTNCLWMWDLNSVTVWLWLFTKASSCSVIMSQVGAMTRATCTLLHCDLCEAYCCTWHQLCASWNSVWRQGNETGYERDCSYTTSNRYGISGLQFPGNVAYPPAWRLAGGR
jgi:hypothetical protein